MGLTSALYSTLTGLNANQARLDVIGNNISNVNTVGFKSSRVDFETLFSQTVSNGSAPSAESGGTNPVQVGLGVKEGAVTRNFTDGSRQVTGVNTDLAIEGDGFFILQQGTSQVFTRDGTFKLNSQNQLVNASGDLVQGYGVDKSFNVVPGTLSGITVPLGSLTVAEPTTTVSLKGNLNAEGNVATTTSYLTSQQALYLAGAGTPSATPPAGTDLLTNIVDPTNAPYFAVGDKIDFTPPSSGAGLQSTKKTLTVTSTTTLQDYMDFMSGTMGIDTAVGANGAAPDGGVTIQAVVPPTAAFPANSVQLAVRGNLGLVNNLALSSQDISVTTGSTTKHPFGFDQVTAANGESSSTPVDVYDSLGNHLTLNVTAVLTSRTSSGTAWQYYATSPDGTAGSTTGGVGTQSFVGSGTLNFDNFGNLVNSTTPSLTLNRANTGAVPTLTFTLGFTNTQAFAGGNTQLTVADSDGSLKGTLTGFSIQNDGTVDGAFSNGLHRTLGQVALATFQNNQGLVDAGNNTFVPGANSGLPAISAPGQFSTGTIVAGTLELSNVDLSQEFVNLISASTGFSASSRIITTSNQLLQELLQSAR